MNRNSSGALHVASCFQRLISGKKIHIHLQVLTSYGKCWKNFSSTVPCAVACIFSFLLRLIREFRASKPLTHRSSCGLKILPQEVLAFRKSYRKEVLAVLTSNRKEVLSPCRIQAQATRKKPQEVAGLRTQKEVLARALFLGCTVTGDVDVVEL